MFRWVLFVTIILCLGLPLPAQQDSTWTEERCKKLKSLLKQFHEDGDFNGTVLIAEKGETKFHESFGYSSFEAQTPLDETASFRLASVSKQFTAMGIMILKEAKKLDYDDPITKHLPSLPYKNVTIRHLLHHTSGLPDYMMLMTKHWDNEKRIKDRKVATNKDVVKVFSEHKPKLVFDPGDKFSYSNTGYVFLGSIIEAVSGQSPRVFFKQRVFDPLEMNQSQIFVSTDEFNPKHRVYGYSTHLKKPNDHHFLNGMFGDGGVYASAKDLLKWDQALYSEQLVKQSTMREAYESGKLSNGSETGYGFGWIVIKKKGDKLQVSHSGGWVGFSTYISRNIADNRTLIILNSNSQYPISQIRSGIKNILQQK